MKKLQANMCQYGRSMVEMLGVLAIIGVLSIGAIAGYNTAVSKHKMNKTIEQMAQIASNVRTIYQNDKDYSLLDNALAIKLGIFPTEMVADENAGTVVNLYQGSVTLKQVEGNAEEFEIIFEGLPQDVAAQLGMTDWGTNEDDLQQVKLKDSDQSTNS